MQQPPSPSPSAKTPAAQVAPAQGPDGPRVLARGLGASPGKATGPIVFRWAAAVEHAKKGTPAIFVCVEASAEDIEGLKAAAAILTTRGGLTGDAAIVARSLGKPCIAGCSTITVSYAEETMTVAIPAEDGRSRVERLVFHRGDVVTLDGTSGTVLSP